MNEKSIWEESVFYEKTNNNIFYHMFCINDALERFERTYKKIVVSGLINNIDCIYINCVGPKKLLLSKSVENKYKVRINLGQHSKDESETLNLLRDYSINNNIGNSLYLHSKGVTHPKKDHEIIQAWVDCMEYFLIEQYNNCLKILKNYDNCGVNLVVRNFWIKNSCHNPAKKSSYYAGNFWWSTNKYLSTLDKCTSINRWDSETRFLNPYYSKHKELYKTQIPFYMKKHTRNYYTNAGPIV